MRTWAITHEGEVYREVDLTLNECEKVCAITKQSWDGLTPFDSPSAYKAVLAVFLARKGNDIDETMDKLGELSAHELLSGFEWTDDEDRPEEYEVPEGKVPMGVGKAGTESEASSTTTSSSSSGGSTPSGRRTSRSDKPSAT
jgi:hypothetical protein